MIATLLFALFIITMLMGVPIGASLGLAGAAAIALANAQAPWFGLLRQRSRQPDAEFLDDARAPVAEPAAGTNTGAATGPERRP